MYNKLFTKILDSSVWLEPSPTRIVWLTLIAAMDEDGFVQFASVPNLSHRARVSLEETIQAVSALEGPDENSSDPDHEGRRIERVAGGWMILNSAKYRDLVTRTIARERTRLRVAKHREKKASNAHVTRKKRRVTQSEAVTHTSSGSISDSQPPTSDTESPFAEFWKAYPKRVGKANAEAAWKKHGCDKLLPQILVTVRACKISHDWTKEAGQFIPHPATWLNRRGWDDELLPVNKNGSHSIRENIRVPVIDVTLDPDRDE